MVWSRIAMMARDNHIAVQWVRNGELPCPRLRDIICCRQLIIIGAMLIGVLSCGIAQAVEKESFRLRVENSSGGRIQVSLSEGKDYVTVGRVRRPAVTSHPGFAASKYLPDGTVAAMAIHGIRLKIGTEKSAGVETPMSVSLVPLEFDTTPDGYGGHIAYGSGIYTDIHAGCAIFRNFAPLVGSPISLEKGGALTALPRGWKPSGGEVLVIIVSVPEPYLKEIELENRQGGAVTATYTNGTVKKIATVQQPLKGTGRFDGTSYTGVGLINTNHGGVVTVSTAPITASKLIEGKGSERRGGFEIQPSEHYKTQAPMPQAMVIAPIDGASSLEGLSPVFSSFLSLAYDPSNPTRTCKVEVKQGTNQWNPMPQIIGKQDSSIKDRGITAFRVLFPKYDRTALAKLLEADRKRALSSSPTVAGTEVLRPKKSVPSGSVVYFCLDGKVLGADNNSPYEYIWNTRSADNGEHTIEIQISDTSGANTVTERRVVNVENT